MLVIFRNYGGKIIIFIEFSEEKFKNLIRLSKASTSKTQNPAFYTPGPYQRTRLTYYT